MRTSVAFTTRAQHSYTGRELQRLARLAAGRDTDQQRGINERQEPTDLETLPDAELAKLWAKVQQKRGGG